MRGVDERTGELFSYVDRERRVRALVVRADSQGEIAFGALQASLNIDYGPDEIGFTWAGFDEMDEVSGSGSAELQADGSYRRAYSLTCSR